MNRQEYFQLMEAAAPPLFRKKNKKGKKHKAHEKKETAAKEKMEDQEEKFGGKEVEESDTNISIYNGVLVRLKEARLLELSPQLLNRASKIADARATRFDNKAIKIDNTNSDPNAIAASFRSEDEWTRANKFKKAAASKARVERAAKGTGSKMKLLRKAK